MKGILQLNTRWTAKSNNEYSSAFKDSLNVFLNANVL